MTPATEEISMQGAVAVGSGALLAGESTTTNMKRVEQPVSLAKAKARLKDFRETHGSGPHRAATLAEIIWPDARFITAQGAGAAASRVLKKLGCVWTSNESNWGWCLYFSETPAEPANR